MMMAREGRWLGGRTSPHPLATTQNGQNPRWDFNVELLKVKNKLSVNLKLLLKIVN